MKQLLLSGILVALSQANPLAPFLKTPPPPLPADTGERGKDLARVHCQRCHLMPDPASLPQKLWVNHVLPEMGCYLGLHHEIPPYRRFVEQGQTANERETFKQAGLYPEAPVIKKAEWDEILRYYISNSPPQRLPSNNRQHPALPQGKFRTSFIGPTHPNPQITFVDIDEEKRRILAADAGRHELTTWHPNGSHQHSLSTPSPIVARDDNQFLAIGVLPPSDQKRGQILRQSSDRPALTRLFFPPLKRPVDFLRHDFDGDGQPETVVAEYGNKTGQLSLHCGSRKKPPIILNKKAGNCRLKLADVNQDGRQDLVVLCAQEVEEVLIYYHVRALKFRESIPLKFPPQRGSNDLDLADLNGDGHLDLLLCQGDNADSTMILKNSHGLRIFLGDGNGGFKPSHHFPLHGAYGCEVFDYDLDGDLDLIVFSAFPDFRRAQMPIYLLEQQDPLAFQPFAILDSQYSRWITADSGDADGDGDIDLIFGSILPGPSPIPESLTKSARKLSGALFYLENLRN